MSRSLILVALAGCGFQIGGVAPDAGPVTDVAPEPDAPGDGGSDPCKAVQVAASSAHSCARMENGDVWCWGKNGRGEVGRPPQTSCASNVACNPSAEKLDLTAVTGLGLGDEHSCAFTDTETYCFGANDAGQLGDGTTDGASVPRAIPQRAGARALVGGAQHTCSLHGGVVRCSGSNTEGELGDNTLTMQLTPVETIDAGVGAIGTGYRHACAVSAGFVQCWGDNAEGQIDAMPGDALLPRLIIGFSDARAVAGGVGHTCALRVPGDLRCWGDNTAGQLGIGSTDVRTDVVSPTVLGIVELAAGVDHTCARASGGTVYCWGEGDGVSPTEVPLPRPAISIAAGSYHDCFVLDDGSVWCRGWNAYGQRGLGHLNGQSTDPPTRVALCP